MLRKFFCNDYNSRTKRCNCSDKFFYNWFNILEATNRTNNRNVDPSPDTHAAATYLGPMNLEAYESCETAAWSWWILQYRKISPGLIFVQKAVLLHLFLGKLIFRGAYYGKEFCVSK